MKKLLSIAMLCSLGLAHTNYFIGIGAGNYQDTLHEKVVGDRGGINYEKYTANNGGGTIKTGVIINNRQKLTIYYTHIFTLREDEQDNYAIEDKSKNVIGAIYDFYLPTKTNFKPFIGLGYSYHMFKESLNNTNDTTWDDPKIANINVSSIDGSLGFDYFISKHFFIGLDILISAKTFGDDKEGFTYNGEHYTTTITEQNMINSALSLNFKF